GAGRRVDAPRNFNGLPAAVIEIGLEDVAGLTLEPWQRLLAGLKGQVLVEHGGLEAPTLGEVEAGSRLLPKTGHRLPVLDGHAPSIRLLKIERRREGRGADVLDLADRAGAEHGDSDQSQREPGHLNRTHQQDGTTHRIWARCAKLQ